MRWTIVFFIVCLSFPALAAQNDAMCGKDAPDSFISACTLNYAGLFSAYMQSIINPYDKIDIFKAYAGTGFSSALKKNCEYTLSFSTSNNPNNIYVTVYGPPGQTQLAYKSGTSGSMTFFVEDSGNHYFKFEMPGIYTGTHYNFDLDKGECCNDSDYDGWTTCEGDCKDYDAGVNPGMSEKCDNFKDDNCNGQVDEDCECVPYCLGKQCGPDGCGGSCGECEGQDFCNQFQCVCEPDCATTECGDDGCGGSCGQCPPVVFTGDINGSGGVSVSDLQCLILAVNAPMGELPTCMENAEFGDVNCDGSHDVIDIQLEVEMVLRFPDPGMPESQDPDGDNIHSDCDNCPQLYNPYQIDDDQNQVGDICQ